MLALVTGCPTLRLFSPFADAEMEATVAPAVVMAALTCAAPALQLALFFERAKT